MNLKIINLRAIHNKYNRMPVPVKKIVGQALVTFLALFCYTGLSLCWVIYGGSSAQVFKLEYPLVHILAVFLFFPARFKTLPLVIYFLPFVPVFGLYALYDIFYNLLDRSLRISDFQDFPTLINTYPGMANTIIIYMIAIFMPTVVSFIKWEKDVGPLKALRSIVLRTSALCLLLFLISTETFALFQKEYMTLVEWSDARNIRKNGRFISIVYYHNKRTEAIGLVNNSITSSEQIKSYTKLFPGTVQDKMNVHIIVLESFIDPRLLKDVNYNRSPLAKDMERFLIENKHFSIVVSPRYGGGTAQAEFEILTGVHAYAAIESIEFNTMDGFFISSLVNRLRDYDYFTSAMIATDSYCFNSRNAYKSIGFEQTIFLEEDQEFKKTPGDKRIFDGDVYEYNLKKLKSSLQNGKKPILNYILGMYGHASYRRNIDERPDVIESSHPDKRIDRVANQFYYRTKSLAYFLDQLIQIDPHSIILVISDHLPPLLNNNIEYKKDKYDNIALLLSDTRKTDISGKKYFEIPWIIWDILSGANNRHGIRNITNLEMQTIYFQILAECMGVNAQVIDFKSSRDYPDSLKKIN